MDEHDAKGDTQSIAVIGMSARFPGARNVEEFWRNLRNGVESIRFFSRSELQGAGVDPELMKTPGFVGAGGVLDDVEWFDAPFFGLSPVDAEIMDPQHRLFLECAWEGLEHAGYDPERYDGLIGVFAGSSMSTYLIHLYANAALIPHVDQFQLLLGNDKDHLVTQVSYKLNLKGPSVAVQTACSTSLVAATMACHSLLTYQCDMALAGGAAIGIPQRRGYFYQAGSIASPDGHCRPFDAAAQGTVSGNGVGVVVLKRLADALADGDHVHAIIRGAALNNDGSLKVGYTAPSVDGQAQVIAMAQMMARVNPDTVTYVEAHGTATPLGDPIEVAALSQVFGASSDRHHYCALGSVKSNVGHLDPAAGVAGLIKTILCLENGELVPSLHYTQPNPKIDFARSPFFVNTQLRPWLTEGMPRRAGVSSFGIGGTNAHLVLEQAPPLRPSGPSRPSQILLISAKTTSALEIATEDLASHLQRQTTINLADVAYTTHVGRRAFSHRRVAIVANSDPSDAALCLLERTHGRVLDAVVEPRERPIVFLFPGQGSPYACMGLGLHQTERVFQEQVAQCCEMLVPPLGCDLREILFPSPERREQAETRLRRTEFAQPALFTVEYALARLWESWGIVPQALLGHSIGEYVAACLAGVFSLQDALRTVATRGRLMQQMAPGDMLAVALPKEDVLPLLIDSGLHLAAHNAPSSCVVSGPVPSVAKFAQSLEDRGVECQRLRTSHAFHSAMMDPSIAPFARHLRTLNLTAPRVPILSNLTGTWMTPEEAADADYWGRHLRHTVRFSDAAAELLKNEDVIVLEVGPGRILSSLVQQQPRRSSAALVLSSLPAVHDRRSDHDTMLTALGQLWLSGASIDWSGFHAHERPRRVPLPTYPFERQRYWIGASEADLAEAAAARPGQREIDKWFYVPAWQAAPNATSTSANVDGPWLILEDTCGVASELYDALNKQGIAAIRVGIGKRFERTGAMSYLMEPRRAEDYGRLFEQLNAGGAAPTTIVHCWSVTENKHESDFGDLQALGFTSLVYLAQALAHSAGENRVQIVVVSNGMHDVTGDEVLIPGKSTLAGPCRVIPQEHPNLRCRSIDVTVGGRVGRLLLTEITAEPFAEAVAYRNGRRWVRTWRSLPLAPCNEPPLRLRTNGVYVITGGLGSIGLTLAEFLAETVRAKLVLIGSSPFPPRSEWPHWSGQASEVAEKVRRLMRMESAGSEVLVLQADVADRQQIDRALQAAEAGFGRLHGVIHGAGRTSKDAVSPLERIDTATADVHFRPKVHGVRNLADALAGEELDFVVLISSLSSVLGGLGFTAYAAANAFLDATAAAQNRYGTVPWISADWDGWQFPREGDSVATLSAAILPREGTDAFLRILNLAPSQIAVSTTDLQSRLDQWVHLRTLDEAEQPSSGVQHTRPQGMTTAFAPPETEVEKTIASIWERLLGVAPIGVHDNFFELGGHSLLAIQLLSRMREQFRIELAVDRLFDAPTIHQLAASIQGGSARPPLDDETVEALLARVEQYTDEEVEALLVKYTSHSGEAH